ncbi:MAG: sugar ABC transporter permease [Firmicutes bacterium]|nr:sugar ABC transporter permease [Bacillota bacterium]
MTKGKRLEWSICYLFLLPNIILYLLVRLIPFGSTIFLSFTDWQLIGAPNFIGLQNFIDMLQYPVFWKAFNNTLMFAVYTVPLSIIFGLLMAVLVNRDLPGMKFFRSLYFLPYVTSVVFVAVIWRWLFATDTGLINVLLERAGIAAIPWLSSPKWALFSLAIVAVWQNVSFNMLVFLAGLQGIGKDVYEAATIDGATGVQSFIYMTVPLLKPTMTVAAIMTTINSFQVFDLGYVMTQGGPLDSTYTLVYYLYDFGFRYMEMGHASAVAVVLFLMIFSLSILQRVLLRER